MRYRDMMFIAATSLFFSGIAMANPITANLPQSTYIVKNGLKWTWASPVNDSVWITNILKTPDFHQGWRYATDSELLNRPTLQDFDYGAINSAAYWNSLYTHVDAADYLQNYVASRPGNNIYETLYVASVPEPATVLQLLTGLGLLIGLTHRSKFK